MSIPKNEQMPSEEYEDGGPIRDHEDFKPAEYFDLEVGLDFKAGSVRGKIGAPAPLAPLALILVAMMLGGVIWALWLWQAGVAVMVGSLIVYVISIFVTRRK